MATRYEVDLLAAILCGKCRQWAYIKRLRRRQRLPPTVLPTVDRIAMDGKLRARELRPRDDVTRPRGGIGMKDAGCPQISGIANRRLVLRRFEILHQRAIGLQPPIIWRTKHCGKARHHHLRLLTGTNAVELVLRSG